MHRHDATPALLGSDTRPAPLFPAAIGLITGIIADACLAPARWSYVAALTIPIALHFIRRHNVRFATAAAIVVMMLLGGARHALADRYLASDHIWHHSRPEPALVTLTGRILTTPEIVEPDPDIPRAHAAGPRTRFILQARELDGIERPVSVSGGVAVNIRDAVLHAQSGDAIRMTGWLYQPPPKQNPGGIDWALYQRRQGLRVGFSCQHAESVRVIGRAASDSGSASLANLRSRFRNMLTRDAFDPDDPAAGVVAAMVLAQRSAVSRELNDAFVRTGNAHFLAASGMNVAWLVWLAWSLMRMVGVHYRSRALVIAALIASYVLLAEPEPSILRAGIAGLLWCVSVFLRGRPHGLNWLACSAIVVLLIDPLDVFRPAFQFSFLGVLALMYVEPSVIDFISTALNRLRMERLVGALQQSRQGDLSLPLALGEGLRGVARWLTVRLLELLSGAIAAWFITAPLAWLTFGTFTPWGWLNTFILSFVALPLTSIGYVTAVLAVLFPSSTALLGHPLSWTTHAMTALVHWMGRFPATVLHFAPPPAAIISIVYLLLALWTLRRIRLRREEERIARLRTPALDGLDDLATPVPDSFPTTRWRRLLNPLQRWGLAAAILLLLIYAVVPARWLRGDFNSLHVWMLAVGDGTGTIIELPDGRVWIYDFGTRSDFDVGPVATAFLRHRGIRAIERVIISHANFDHYSGLETLVREFPVGVVTINDHFEAFAAESEPAQRCLAAIRAAGIPIDVLHGPAALPAPDGVSADILWPPARAEQTVIDPNDTSTVLSLTYEGRRVLLTGDIEEMAQAAFLARGNLRADILALPHHGAVVHNTTAFLDAVNPAAAIRSTAQRRALTITGIETLVAPRRYYSTADDGCVHVSIRDGEISVRSMAEGLD